MWKSLALIAAIAIATAGSAGAASPRDQLVVTPAWLAAHLNDKDLVILHVGTEAGYKAGHIPGAHLVAPKNLQVSTPGGLIMEVPPPDTLRREMEALGISDNSHIVVYNQGDEFQRATRVLFTLDVAGFGDRSSLLDGGLAAWTKEGHPASSEAAPAATGHLSPLKMQPRVVDADFVKAHLKAPGYDLIDARDAVFYGGLVAKVTGDGHIPGARSLPYTSVYNSDGTLKTEKQLKAMFTAAGVKPGDHVIAYCQVGGQSSAVYFAARAIGIQPQLYDGSFQDWSKRGLPVVTSSSPGK
jgi:thiosulfate/3-mercaptopyruvate sulfurtransferase